MRLALECLAPLVAQDRVLGWFPQRDVDEAGARGQAAVPLEDPAGGLDLLRRQRLQRMPNLHPGVLSRLHHPLLPWLPKPRTLADGSGRHAADRDEKLAGAAHGLHARREPCRFGRFLPVLPQTNWYVKRMNSSFAATRQ